MHISEYRIIESVNIVDMSNQIGDMIKDGWQPKDHLVVINANNGLFRVYIQVMYK